MKVQFSGGGLTVFESAIYRTTSCVYTCKEFTLLADPNFFPIEIRNIRRHVERESESDDFYLFFTHSDFDHIVGFNAFPGAKVIASKAFKHNRDSPAQMKKLKTVDDDFYILRDTPVSYPKVDIVIDKTFESLQFENTELCFYQAPGHNADSMFCVIEPAGIFICGDYLSNIEFPFIYSSFRLYWDTLKLAQTILDTCEIKFLIPGHGEMTTDISEMQVDNARDYLEKLRNCIESGVEFDEERLWKKYHFPISMRKYHQENLALCRAEFSL